VPQPFSIGTREADGVTIFEVAGDLDLSTAPALYARIDQAFQARATSLLVDLSRLEFCDSTGLRALFGAVQEARVRRVRLKIVPPSSANALRVFELAGASEFLPLVTG
jgi:anti-sigma B factor antagonist